MCFRRGVGGACVWGRFRPGVAGRRPPKQAGPLQPLTPPVGSFPCSDWPQPAPGPLGGEHLRIREHKGPRLRARAASSLCAIGSPNRLGGTTCSHAALPSCMRACDCARLHPRRRMRESAAVNCKHPSILAQTKTWELQMAQRTCLPPSPTPLRTPPAPARPSLDATQQNPRPMKQCLPPMPMNPCRSATTPPSWATAALPAA